MNYRLPMPCQCHPLAQLNGKSESERAHWCSPYKSSSQDTEQDERQIIDLEGLTETIQHIIFSKRPTLRTLIYQYVPKPWNSPSSVSCSSTFLFPWHHQHLPYVIYLFMIFVVNSLTISLVESKFS